MTRIIQATVSIVAVLFLVVLSATACCEGAQMQASIQEVKSRHEAALIAAPGVVSVGIGLADDGAAVIIVGIDRDRPEIRAKVPQTIEGYRVRVEVIGTIKAQ